MMINTDLLTHTQVVNSVDRAFEEDLGDGDITTNAIVGDQLKAKAVWIAKEDGVVTGLQVAEMVFRKLDKNLKWTAFCREGEYIREGAVIAEFQGNCRAILSAERIALNFAQRMSGIATKTSRMVKKLEDFHTTILDTRKTVPGLRLLDKYAVATGGGVNHRLGLYDMAMIKDNHIVAAGTITKAVQQVRISQPGLKIEVETTNLDQVKEAVAAKADMIMLDNMSIEQMEEAVRAVSGKAQTEASGNITEESVRDVAAAGVDFISAGALTHSVQAFDISQRVKNIY